MVKVKFTNIIIDNKRFGNRLQSMDQSNVTILDPEIYTGQIQIFG